MLDIGAMELFLVAILALVVVGPKELPALLRGVGGLVNKARELAGEFRAGVKEMADEVERELDPFGDLKGQEGITPDMTPNEITDHIMKNRTRGHDPLAHPQTGPASNPVSGSHDDIDSLNNQDTNQDTNQASDQVSDQANDQRTENTIHNPDTLKQSKTTTKLKKGKGDKA